MVKLIVCGAKGKMGSAIASLAMEDPGIELIGLIEKKGHSSIGRTMGGLTIQDDLKKVISLTDVIVDFTEPTSSVNHIKVAKEYRKSIVIGTTGLSSSEKRVIKECSEEIACVLSPNMSVGVNVLFSLVQYLSRLIPDSDIEIVEAHHNKKKDAPSGTALRIAEIIAEALKRDLNKEAIYGRKGKIGPRKKQEIGIHAVRAGTIVGEHRVLFGLPAERIEITHIAENRNVFAIGAILATKWVVGKKPGLYNMKDVLNIEM